MRFSLLGPLTVTDTAGNEVAFGGPRLRVLLVALLLHAGIPVPTDELIEVVWDGTPPSGAVATLRSYIRRLRRSVGDDGTRIAAHGHGYLIHAERSELDILEFEAFCRDARTAVKAGEWAGAFAAATDALRLWRATPLLDVPAEALREEFVPRFERLRLQALEDRFDAGLRIGEQRELIPDLLDATAQHPMQERFHAQLMVALAADGRRAQALHAYQEARRVLIDELGIEPGPELRDIYQRLLADDAGSVAGRADDIQLGEILGDEAHLPTAKARAGRARVPAVRQLPLGSGHFVGRDTELKELDTLLDSAGRSSLGVGVVAAVRGMAGVGKTALAIHWARSVADRFPDGQLYVNLRGFDAEGTPLTANDVNGWFLTALGVPAATIPAEPQARASLYRSVLADRRVLIILDNARDAVQVRPLLAGGPGCLALVTSRSPLSGLAALEGASLIRLGQLSDAEAANLLAARLGAQRISAETDAVADLVQRCAGLPLALAIIAARAAEFPQLPLSMLAAELDAESRRLDGLDGGDESASVRGVFSWSLRHVSGPAARMFALLGVHSGPDISLHAAASLAALPVSEARALLTELAGASLVAEHRPGRYVLHDLLRVYATEHAADSYTAEDICAAIARSVDHYLHTIGNERIFADARLGFTLPPAASGVSPERPEDWSQMLAWLDVEHPVLLRTIEQAATVGFSPQGWQLFAYFADAAYWRGTWGFATLGQTLVSAATAAGDHVGLGWIRRALAQLTLASGATDAAFAEYQRSLEHFILAGDLVGQARIHQIISNLYSDADAFGRYPAATSADEEAARAAKIRADATEGLRHARLAYALYRQLDDRLGQAILLCITARHYACLGEIEPALAMVAEAMDHCRDIDSPRLTMFAWDSLAMVHRANGDPHLAISSLLRALEAIPHTLGGAEDTRALLLMGLGDDYRSIGDLREARRAWVEALKLYEHIHNPAAERIRARLDQLPAR